MVNRINGGVLDVGLFADDSESSTLVSKIAKDGELTKGALEAAYFEAKASGSPDKDVLLRMLKAASSGKLEKRKSPLEIRLAGAATAGSGIDAELDAFSQKLNQRIKGQDAAKAAMRTIEEARLAARGKKKGPFAMMFPGPPGVGKTEFARALAEIIHGDRNKVAMIDCSQIKNEADFTSIFGSSPGYVGYVPPEQFASPVSPNTLNGLFGDKRPRIFLFDEVDKIGNGDPKVIQAFGNLFGDALQDGPLKFPNGAVVNISGDIVIFTSNAGAGAQNAKSLKGDALLKHYENAMIAAIPSHITSRVGNVVPFGPHTQEVATAIAEQKLDAMLQTFAADQREQGDEITLSAGPGAAKLIAEMGINDAYGARPIERIINTLAQSIVARKSGDFRDEEHWELRVKPEYDELARAAMKKKFDSQAGGGIPPEVTPATFPLELVCKNKRPDFHPYAGSVPLSDFAPPVIHASGSLAGRGFVLMNKGETGSENELVMLRPGKTQEKDEYRSIALPPELASPNNVVLYPAAPSDTQLVLAGVRIEDDQVRQSVQLYDAVKKRFQPLPEPPVALVDASFVAHEGKVYLLGGRSLEKTEEGWTVKLRGEDLAYDPTENSSVLIDGVAWMLDLNATTPAWNALASAPKVPRAGMSAVSHPDGKIYFIGGDHVSRTGDQVDFSESSNAVDVFDPKSGEFSEAQPLPLPVSRATAFVDALGVINVLGGTALYDRGRQLEPKNTFLRFDPARNAWKSRDPLPVPAAGLATVAHIEGRLVGPFYDEESASAVFSMLK